MLQPAPLAIERASQSDLVRLRAILVDAFDEDPVMNWFVRQDAARARGFEALFDWALRQYLKRGEVYTDADRSGVALWAPPGVNIGTGLWAQLRSLPSVLRMSGWRGLPRLNRVCEFLDERRPTEPHAYLYEIGVERSKQGQGVGSALLRDALDRFDRQGAAAYAENSNERNLPLYLRLGFEVKERVVLPDGGPPVWLIWREPAHTQSQGAEPDGRA